jgi:hypothetical protein
MLVTKEDLKYRMQITLCNFFFSLVYCSFLAELQPRLFYTNGSSPMLLLT